MGSGREREERLERVTGTRSFVGVDLKRCVDGARPSGGQVIGEGASLSSGDVEEQGRVVWGGEGSLSGAHRIEDATQRPDVGSGVGVSGVSELFGGHIGQRPQYVAGLGQALAARHRLSDEAKISNLRQKTV